jgi:hypothetical protein
MKIQDFTIQNHGVKYKSWEEVKGDLYELLVVNGFKEIDWLDFEQGWLFFYQLEDGFMGEEAVMEALNNVFKDYNV